jgi:uroporphyrinogen-III synthase
MAHRVLVTRPAPEARRTSLRLVELGFEPVELALTEIVALPVAAESLPARINAVAVTSGNALRHATPELIALLAGKPCFAVGAKTAQQARTFGFSAVEEGPGDAEGLAGLAIRRLGTGARIAYLSGRVRLSGFEAHLAQAGIGVDVVETYDTRPVSYDQRRLAGAIGTEPVDAVLLYSAMAARAFALIDWPEPGKNLLAGARLICLSPRVGEELRAVGDAQILVAPEPTESALLRLLDRPGA